MSKRTPPATEVVIAATEWTAEPRAEAIVTRAIAAAAEALETDGAEGEVAVMLADDAAVRALNRDWRGLDKPTNVLSFPAPATPAAPGAPRHLGDIAIAYQTTRREADDDGKPFADHLSHLAVHGFLHLVGYDHETAADAEAMEAMERAILARLGVADPYAGRDLVSDP